MRPLIAKAAASLGLLAGGMASAHADWAVNMPRGVTSVSESVYEMHMLAFWIVTVIGVFVFGAIFWSLIHHRKSRGHAPARWHESMSVEIAWTIVPFIILIGMAVPAALVMIEMDDDSGADLTVKVTGYQWLWHYEYVDDEVDFYSRLATSRQAILGEADKPEDYLLGVDNALILPVERKVRFHHTSGDVLHSWWVPAFSVKKDSIPGYINTNWATIEEPGIYYGKCAELCGRGHGFMPITVKAIPADEFDEWLELKQAGDNEAADQLVEAYFADSDHMVAERP